MTLEKIHEKFDMVHLDSLKIFENANYIQLNDTSIENAQEYYHYIISYACAQYICNNTDLPVYKFRDLDIYVVGVYCIGNYDSDAYVIPYKGYYQDILNAQNGSCDEVSKGEN